MKYLCELTGVHPGPQRPDGVFARKVEGRTLYVNTAGEGKRIPIAGSRKGIIGNRVYEGAVVLGPQEVELVPSK